MDALTLLLERRSCAALTKPAPAGEALETILHAALRVPDFQKLRPFRFLIATGDGLERLGEMMAEAASLSGQPPNVIERAPKMPLRAPMVIVVAAVYHPSTVVKRFEQQLSAGCAVMAMQMAALAQGFGGIWRSGWPMFDRNLHRLLGLDANTQIVGFLYLGTPVCTAEKQLERPDPWQFVERL